MNPRRYFHERRVPGPFLRWIVPAVVILLAVAGSGDSEGSGPTTSTGARVTKHVPFVRESIDEIRALAPLRSRAVPGDRVYPLSSDSKAIRCDGRSGIAVGRAAPLAAPFFASSPASSAPVLDSSFAGLGNPPHSQGDVIPPDTMGAAGPNHLVSLLNSDFGVFDKTTGAELQKISLQSFWGSLGTAAGEPADFPFDPKILYDQHSGRFVAVTLGGSERPGFLGHDRRLPIVRSHGSMGQMGHRRGPGQQCAAVQQLPRIFRAWAWTPSTFTSAANMFSGAGIGQYGKVWVIPKAQLLAGSNPITWFEFRDPPGSDFTMQPAHTFGAAAAEYVLFEGSPNRLGVAWIDNVSGTPVWHSPLQVPVTPYTSTSFLPGAPQLGIDCTVDTADTRLLNVRVPERLSVDHPPSRRKRKGGGRLVPDQPGNRHGGVAGTHQRPESLVLLPLHRGQQGQRRRRSGSAARRPPNSSGGTTPSSGHPPAPRSP